MKWSAPDSKVEYFHHDIGCCHVHCCTFDDQVLLEVLGEPPVEEQQADFGTPLNGTHTLFDQQNGFRPPGSHRDLVRCQVDGMRRIDKIRRDIQINVEEDNEDRVQALTRSVRSGAPGPVYIQ